MRSWRNQTRDRTGRTPCIPACITKTSIQTPTELTSSHHEPWYGYSLSPQIDRQLMTILVGLSCRLPIDIRIQLTFGRTCSLSQLKPVDPTTWIKVSNNATSLLRTCKAIYAEAYLVYVERNTSLSGKIHIPRIRWSSDISNSECTFSLIIAAWVFRV